MDQRCVRTCAVLCAVLGLITLAACGGGSSGSVTPPPPPPKVTLSSIAVTPAGPSIVAGSMQQFKATGTFSDGSTQDLTSSATWTSSNTSAATISSGGLATGVAAGPSTISAKQDSITGSTTLTITAPPAKLVSITVTTPDKTSIVRGTTEQFTAMGKFDDGTSHPVTSSVTWKSDNTNAATINSSGVATGVAAESGTPASANISATSGTITSNSVSLKVVSSAIPRFNWILHRVDSQDQTNANHDEAIGAIDGDPNTFWETNTTSPTPFPHEIEVDLGARYNITGFTYLPRQDGSPDGTISQYEFSVSNDAISEANSDWTVVNTGAFAANTKQKEADFAPVVGRYVRLKALSEINGKNETSIAELGVLGTPVGASSQNNFSLLFADSEATTPLCTTAELATNSFDGNPATFWQTQETPNCPSSAALPHEFQINLGNPQVVNGFRYLPRQDGSTDGMIAKFNFFTSTDGVNWGSAAATGTFTATLQQKEVPFPDIVGQFVRLQALTEVNGGSSTSAAEINVLQCAVTPSVLITQPATYDVQTSTSLTVTAQACLDATAQAGWGVRFTLDGGAAMDVHSQPFQATFAGAAKAEHTLKAQIIDNKGNLVSGPGTLDQIASVGVGDYFVAMGDSLTVGFNDDILSDDTSKDGRRSGSPFGGWEPILDDLRTTREGFPQRVANEGVGGAFAGQLSTCPGNPSSPNDGINLAPVLLLKHPNTQMFLLMYGTNDSAAKIASGQSLKPGDPGYACSFKDDLQRVIDIITAAGTNGKKVALAKVPMKLGDAAMGTQYPDPKDVQGNNPLISSYNTAIDELVAANSSVVIAGPDFFTYFDNHQTQFFDNWHPDGAGFQGMAGLWDLALQAVP